LPTTQSGTFLFKNVAKAHYVNHSISLITLPSKGFRSNHVTTCYLPNGKARLARCPRLRGVLASPGPREKSTTEGRCVVHVFALPVDRLAVQLAGFHGGRLAHFAPMQSLIRRCFLARGSSLRQAFNQLPRTGSAPIIPRPPHATDKAPRIPSAPMGLPLFSNLQGRCGIGKNNVLFGLDLFILANHLENIASYIFKRGISLHKYHSILYGGFSCQ